ncbi:peptidoglycan DD-metalloendopeptidase family protein [Streptomyces spongiicola]|uniref:M23 family metallopeptidase n=1 Tax=Streptomyces spongiicola TaxID=1690221 RepID=UPI003411C648
MNDQHPHAGYDAYATGGFGTDPLFGALPGGPEDAHLAHGGLYGTEQWPAAPPTGYDDYGNPQHAYGQQYDATHFGTAQHDAAGHYDAAGHHEANGQYDATGHYGATGQWDANAWNEAGQFTAEQFESQPQSQPYDTGGHWTATGHAAATSYETGAYDATAWNSAGADTTAVHPPYGDHAGQTPEPEHSGYAVHGDPHDQASAFIPEQFSPATEFGAPQATRPGTGTGTGNGWETEAGLGGETATWTETGAVAETTTWTETGAVAETATWTETGAVAETATWTETGAVGGTGTTEEHAEYAEYEPQRSAADAYGEDVPSGHDHEAELIAAAATVTAPAVTLASADPARPVRRAGGARGRRRTPAKRSALLTVAVPSVCVMGVAGVAAASVGGLTDGDQPQDGKSAVTAADKPAVKPVVANNALDTQLAALSADARDFGDRASRTQERIDLKARQEAERKKREEEAVLREKLRPKFALPVAQRGLSAYYGQAGVNWMSMHTGIDFPVSYGTPVMAATDGTVRTQWNSAYGNMAIVTAADGTETWYCHLSSTKIRSGQVKAGDVIAYSGNSGNSTGPHLHFEVRPGGGSAIDPLAWLRSHGLSPA